METVEAEGCADVIVLRGLRASVDLFRDDLGIAHIRASNTADAFFAQGYLHAQDRLWQMDQDRLKAQGRLAEYLGQPGLAQDRLMRRFQLYKSSQRDYQLVQPETRSMLDAYAAGVNASSHRVRTLA
jgi:penicillin amidase